MSTVETFEVANRIVGNGEENPEQLLAHPLNFRRHPGNQMDALRGSLKELGWLKTVLVNKRTGHVIDGHARVEEALRQGLASIPVTYLDLSEQEERLALSVLDQIVTLAETDDEILRKLMDETTAEEEVLNRMLQAMRDEAAPVVERQEVALFTEEQVVAAVIAAWPEPKSPREVVAGIITPAMAMGQFNQLASGAGGTVGYWISALFNPHRLTTERGGVKNQTFIAGCYDPKVKDVGAKFVARQYGGDLHPSVFVKYSGVGWANAGATVYEFKPVYARDLYLRFCRPGARVLDPCHGWGGRVIGWLAANLGGHYVGFDPAPETSAGWRDLVAFLKQSGTGSTAENFCLPFEDAQLDAESFDFALTSPPYFDTELYSDAPGESHIRYGNFDAWVEGFYKPFVLGTIAALKRGATFVANVGDKQYPLTTLARQFAGEAGCTVKGLDDYFIGRAMLLGEKDQEVTENRESFLAITKPA